MLLISYVVWYLMVVTEMNVNQIKEDVLGMGMDLCGIAPVERFSDAPNGFHPCDIYKECRSVVVYAKQVPKEVLKADTCIPYTFISAVIMQEVDRLGVVLALRYQKLGIGVIPIPSDDPYEYWEGDRMHGKAILSLRHAGYLAGLGYLGKNTLLINKTFGNMIQLGAVLLNIDLEGDPMVTSVFCPATCRLCLDACPVHALDGITVNQQLCRPLSNYRTEKGYILKKCSLCRKKCPFYCSMED